MASGKAVRVFGARGVLLAGAAAVCLALVGCDEPKDKDAAPAKPATQRVKLGDKTFDLELALDGETRFKGLSDRSEIKADGGMLFVFPDQDVQVQQFVMRDCPNAIDIVYLDRAARITATYTMEPEAPRSDKEKEIDPKTKVNKDYEARLKKYSSKFPSQFVIELKGHTLDSLNPKSGDKVELAGSETWADLKKRAK